MDREVVIPTGGLLVVVSIPENFTPNEALAADAIATFIKTELDAGRTAVVCVPENMTVKLAQEWTDEQIDRVADRVMRSLGAAVQQHVLPGAPIAVR